MEYKSVLKHIEEQKKNEQLSAKLFRYTGLMQAIEFFSQKLNFDQIIDAAFDFVNELLTLEKSAVFVKNGNNYILKKIKGYDSSLNIVEDNTELQNLAIFHGSLLYDREHMQKYFESDVIDTFNVSTVIPLLIDDSLYGFIFISSKALGDMNSDDYIIAESLMKLFNNALENYKRYEELQKANKDLDEKIFNLFAINQSSKALLSELSLDVLYNLSIDVFSELTQSAVTGFVLYDEKSEKYALRSFKDVFQRVNEVNVSLTLNKRARIDINKVIVNVSSEADIAYFNGIFKEGINSIGELKPMYIVLLVKNGRVLGFVSLGQTVTGIDYKASIFELIESLASATYIALSNASLFRQVNEQKRIIQVKLDKLISLNNLMKNINSATKMETLLELAIKTMDISFDVEKALVAIYDRDKNVFDISNTLNITTKKKTIKPSAHWNKVFEGDAIFESRAEGISKYLDKTLCGDIGSAQGILLVPIYIDRVEIEMLGVLMIFKYRKLNLADEENLLTMETIAGHIAPVLGNLFTMEQQSRFMLPNYIQLFKRDLKLEVDEALEFCLDLQVIQVLDGRDFVFRGNAVIGKLQQHFSKVYPFTNNNIFIITNELDDSIDTKLKRITGLSDIRVNKMQLRKDFSNFQDFFKMF